MRPPKTVNYINLHNKNGREPSTCESLPTHQSIRLKLFEMYSKTELESFEMLKRGN